MPRKQVTVSENQLEILRALASRTGKSENQLLNEALEQFLEAAEEEKKLSNFLAAAGIWKDRDDLPDIRELREEWKSRAAVATFSKRSA
ncbi:ribbon-helix-helix protein, CopG family [Candidatus Ozemobacteraceae bacterium]|nr:ribbon-helix-helix protein, CopG family [Candidatus Ozemobacteraceae bacterium]